MGKNMGRLSAVKHVSFTPRCEALWLHAREGVTTGCSPLPNVQSIEKLRDVLITATSVAGLGLTRLDSAPAALYPLPHSNRYLEDTGACDMWLSQVSLGILPRKVRDNLFKTESLLPGLPERELASYRAP